MAKCNSCLYYEVCPLGFAVKGKTGACLKYKSKTDVVEVVRCKNCTAFLRDTEYCKVTGKGYCKYDGVIKSQQHYCSYGERRKENVNRN